MSLTRFAAGILRWFATNARALPWRDQPSPYRVWVSEVMLQQTRVQTAEPYFVRWMRSFPSVKALADASERSVLKTWEGLGYYSRARNMRRAAKILMRQFGGALPADAASLRRLPGIGPYSAGAISSIAFGRDEPALDGNARRVLARFFGVEVLADSPAGTRVLWNLARENLPIGRAGQFNQAVMELGALICLPLHPRCGVCPVGKWCAARKMSRQNRLPLLRKGGQIPHVEAGAAVIRRKGRVLLARRPAGGLLGGLWEFPNVQMRGRARTTGRPARAFSVGLRESYGLEIKRGTLLGRIDHAYTHFRVTVRVYECHLIGVDANAKLSWVTLPDLEGYPMGKVDRHIAARLIDKAPLRQRAR